MKCYKSILVIYAMVGAVVSCGENLLKNPGFEEEGDWSMSQSASLRNQWRHHDTGQYNAAIEGLWATKGLHGSIEQSGIPVTPDKTYVLKAWLWADISWRPEEQYARISYFDDEGQMLVEKEFPLPRVLPKWVEVQYSLTAPNGASKASVSIGARSVSTHGALTIDEVSFAESSETK